MSGGWRWLLLLLLCGPLLSCGPLQFYSGYGRVTSAEIYVVERQRDWPRRPSLTLELSQIKRLGFERVAIAHAGELVFEWQRDPSSDELPPRVHSLTKSLLSALVGIAVAEGQFDLDAPISHLAGCAVPDAPQPLTGRHLLNMTAGFAQSEAQSLGYLGQEHWACAILLAPLDRANGTQFRYSSVQSYLLGVALSQALDQDLRRYAEDKLFAPLGIGLHGWTRSPEGYYFGGGDMRLDALDLLAFGQLYLDGGRYEGRQIIPAPWVEASHQPLWRSLQDQHDPLTLYYGYHWWHMESAGRRALAAFGYSGFVLLIDREAQLVLVAMPPQEAYTPSRKIAARHLAAWHLLQAARAKLD